MENLANPTVIAALVALIVSLLAYSVLVPRNTTRFALTVDENIADATLLKFLSVVSTELYASLPQGAKKDRAHPQLESLLTRSGNPWKVTAQEFFFIQFVTAFLGFLLGWGAWGILDMVTTLPWWLIVGGATILGFMVPRLKYKEQAKSRDLDFKRQLPEALDLIIISLAGGNTFVQALREALPNMAPGVLKEEFKNILASIDTGRTLNESLVNFGERAPNESIKTFVTAVREANELNVPLIDVLQSRAEASRQEFFALIHNKTAQLSSKMMAILTPTLIPAVGIIVLAPALMSLMSSLGG